MKHKDPYHLCITYQEKLQYSSLSDFARYLILLKNIGKSIESFSLSKYRAARADDFMLICSFDETIKMDPLSHFGLQMSRHQAAN